MKVLVVYTDRYSPFTPFLEEYMEKINSSIISQSVQTTTGDISEKFEQRCATSDIVIFCLSKSDENNPAFWKLLGVSKNYDNEVFVLYKTGVEMEILPVDLRHEDVYNVDLPHDLARFETQLTRGDRRETTTEPAGVSDDQHSQKVTSHNVDTAHNDNDNDEWEEAEKVELLLKSWVDRFEKHGFGKGFKLFKTKITYAYLTVGVLLLFFLSSYGINTYSESVQRKNEEIESFTVTDEYTRLDLPENTYETRYSYDTFDNANYGAGNDIDKFISSDNVWATAFYFSLTGQDDTEARLIHKWFESKEWYNREKKPPRDVLLTTDYLLDNVEHLYIEQAVQCVRNGNYGRAAKLSRRAVNLVGTYNINPDLGNTGLQTRLNRVYLLWLLTRHPSRLYKYPQVTQQLADYITSLERFFPESEEASLRSIDTNGELEPITEYFQGVYLYKRNSYDEAFRIFGHLSGSDWVGMKSFANMMAVRTAFWSVYDKDPIPKLASVDSTRRDEELKEMIRSFNDGVRRFSWSEDIEYYISEIKNNRLVQ